MTLVLHPLSHYNSITEPRARFLLSLLEHLTIDFPSHFILSIIDVHLDSASRDKLIFPFAIVRILCHFLASFPASNPFSFMCAIDYTIVKCSEAQFRSRQTDLAPSTCSTPSQSTRSTSAPSMNDVSLPHGTVSAHGCSPRYTLYRDVSGERLCWLYCSMVDDHGQICSRGYSFTTFC